MEGELNWYFDWSWPVEEFTDIKCITTLEGVLAFALPAIEVWEFPCECIETSSTEGVSASCRLNKSVVLERCTV